MGEGQCLSLPGAACSCVQRKFDLLSVDWRRANKVRHRSAVAQQVVPDALLDPAGPQLCVGWMRRCQSAGTALGAVTSRR
jgi:hypothetical protein